MARKKKKLELAGRGEISELLNVTTQRVDQIVRNSRDKQTVNPFPQPYAELKRGSIWLMNDVVAWAIRTGRLPDPNETEPDDSERAREIDTSEKEPDRNDFASGATWAG